MSRCFPYPPPGYTIESIVGVGKEKEKKKKRKREKAEKIRTGQRNDDVISTKEEEDQVERSGITEEHGNPSNYSSDCSSSTRNTRKRLKPANLVEFRTIETPTCPISRRYKERRKAAQQYRELIENWNPPVFSLLLDADCDDDWLCAATKKRANPPEKLSSCSNSTLWPPRALFLPDANTYALPYVLPF